MSLLSFSRSRALEKRLLSQLAKEADWFRKEHFPVTLPPRNGVKKERVTDLVLDARLHRVGSRWRALEPAFGICIKKFQKSRYRSHYRCHVSRFGPEGMYEAPDILYLRLGSKRDESRACETIAHELLHLQFDGYFHRNKLSYAEREGMVDALVLQSNLKRLFPNYTKQSIGRPRPILLKAILQTEHTGRLGAANQ
jgi:hypothetical protein